ncbi:MAG: hypothetical protein ACRDAV_03185 [Plesiomonas shigelloides]
MCSDPGSHPRQHGQQKQGEQLGFSVRATTFRLLSADELKAQQAEAKK